MVLEVRGLNVRIPTRQGVLHPVRGVDLSVAAGETLCVVGESGCGKSLTSLAVMGLLPASARRHADVLRLDGLDLAASTERRMSDLRGNTLAMVFQEPMTSLNPAYSVGEQLGEVWRRHRGATHASARERAAEMLDCVGIADPGRRLAQYPHELSGGLRQRVMIAMALMCEPRLLIADEPTTALDVTIQSQILDLLVSLQQRFGMAMMLITHDFGVVARVAHRVAVMYAGQVVETGTVREVLTAPMHPYSRGLLDCIPTPGGTHRGQVLPTIGGLVPTVMENAQGCGFRNRCALAQARCADGLVPLSTLTDSRAVRCVLQASAGTASHKW